VILAESFQSGLDQTPADSGTLSISGNRHRCEAVSPRHNGSVQKKLNRGKQNVPGDLAILDCDERDGVLSFPQIRDQGRLVRTI